MKIESSQTIDIEKFVPRSEIDPRYMEVPYYIAPEDKVSQEAFAVIREAMGDADVVGLGRVVISRRERIIMLEPFERGLLGTVLRYGYEVRNSNAYFEDIPNVELPDEMKDLAHLIIDRKAGHFDAAEFNDRYEDAVAEMVKAKQGGTTVTSAAPASPGNVINLMEALRKSIGQSGAAKASSKPNPAASNDDFQVPAKPPGSVQKERRKGPGEKEEIRLIRTRLLERDERCQCSPVTASLREHVVVDLAIGRPGEQGRHGSRFAHSPAI